jgi:hypothetical protein
MGTKLKFLCTVCESRTTAHISKECSDCRHRGPLFRSRKKQELERKREEIVNRTGYKVCQDCKLVRTNHSTGICLNCRQCEAAPMPAPKRITFRQSPPIVEEINHPPHYGGEENTYEVIKVVEAWGLGFCLGNTVKYIARAGKKDPNVLRDLKKALWYLTREIENR